MMLRVGSILRSGLSCSPGLGLAAWAGCGAGLGGAVARPLSGFSLSHHSHLLATERPGRPAPRLDPYTSQISLSFGQSLRCFSSADERERGQLIYAGNMAKAVLGVKFFSYSSSLFSLCVMPYILFQSGLGIQNPALQIAFCGIIGFFTFLSPVVLHLITKGYVVSLYHNAETDTYTAVTYNVLLQPKKTVFHQKDVKIPGVSQMFTTFYANKKSLLVNPMLFWHPNDFHHLMGHDQPFSFDMEELKK